MGNQLDYYSILGVLPDAEDIVIRAAYKALAQKYHPDRCLDKEEAARRMAEVNQAYDVLGNPQRRQTYDESRATTNGASYSEVTDDDDENIVYNQSQKDWVLACDFYPDLADMVGKLNQTSKRLALTFMLYLLESKRFDERAKLASEMENRFLQKYFGTDPEILDFAKSLIARGNKAALVYLNNSVRVLGSSTDPRKIIGRIVSQFSGHEGVKKFTDRELSAAVPYWSEFRWSVVKDDAGAVRVLLFKAPALVAGQDSEGNTCLHYAVQEQLHQMVTLLLEHGANPELSNHYKASPLQLARTSKSEKIKSAFRLAGYEI